MSATISTQPACVAVYERTIGASLDRIWENVLDWEHLPWLHADSFSDIAIRHGDRDGWHADVVLADGSAAEVAVTLERAQLRYTTATLAGAGTGTKIITTLAPSGERTTDIRVEFCVPDIPSDSREVVGQFYVQVYEQLWDEDEVMMRSRQQQLDARKEVGRELEREARLRMPLTLGKLVDLRRQLPLVVDWAGQELRIVELDGELVAHSTQCPHLLGPLADAPVVDRCITCPWHGYRFDVRTGASADRRGLRLRAAPRVCVDNEENVFLEIPEVG
ncbi:MAG: nitrite reductase/ring-hydroxylating ferredoxin subunit [Hyphomicrobiaceae bacterium]|jgi:nitrite reductase/ring-hydroxylating ferredoxin subunit